MVAGRDKTFAEVLAGQATMPRWPVVGAEHPLFILYTSGSTGKPKGVQHSTGGYLLWAKMTMEWTFRPEAVRRSSGARPTSAGSPGHTYVAYGPLAGRHADHLRGRAHLPGTPAASGR